MNKFILMLSAALLPLLSCIVFAQEPVAPKTEPQNFLNGLKFSVVGNMLTTINNQEGSPDKNKPVFSLEEVELMMDANLNPYAKATVVLGIHGDNTAEDGDDSGHEAIEVEEAYFTVFQNLPIDRLSLKGGKYRVGFGRLNPMHTHIYPFIEAPRVLSQFLPGEDEGYKDTGFDASYMFPFFFEGASVISFDILSGNDFHPYENVNSKYAYAARLNNSFMIAGEHPFEFGFSFIRNVNNAEYNEINYLYGADVKTKIYLSPSVNLVLQGEAFLNRGTDVEVIENTPPLPNDFNFYNNDRFGFYALANLSLGRNWNFGFIGDWYQRRDDKDKKDYSLKAFAGYALMEETTVLRFSTERYFPASEPAVTSAALQVVFSMGPHKTHLF